MNQSRVFGEFKDVQLTIILHEQSPSCSCLKKQAHTALHGIYWPFTCESLSRIVFWYSASTMQIFGKRGRHIKSLVTSLPESTCHISNLRSGGFLFKNCTSIFFLVLFGQFIWDHERFKTTTKLFKSMKQNFLRFLSHGHWY